MRTTSEITARLTESMARLRDGQAGGDPQGFVNALRTQVLADAPEGMQLIISGRFAEMDRMLDERRALAFPSAITPSVADAGTVDPVE